MGYQSSYAMNERVSKAEDGYFVPDIFSNPADVAKSWWDSMIRVANDPLEATFMTISNDESGNRSWGKGMSEVDARTIKPKVKTFDADMRVTGIPGINVFGAPGSKPGDSGSGQGYLPGDFGKETPKGYFGGVSQFIQEKAEEFGLGLPQIEVGRSENYTLLPPLPKVNLPKVDLPEIELPKVELPKVELPENPFSKGK